MRGNDAKQNDYIVAYVPEYGGNLAVEDHNISVVFQFEILLLTQSGRPTQAIKPEVLSSATAAKL